MLEILYSFYDISEQKLRGSAAENDISSLSAAESLRVYYIVLRIIRTHANRLEKKTLGGQKDAGCLALCL